MGMQIAAGWRSSKIRWSAIGFATLAWIAMQPQANAAGEMLQLAQANAEPALPGGASSLNETHADWSVTCAVRDGRKTCAFLQSQKNNNGQRIVQIELTATAPDKVTGNIVLPFGLALGQGVKMLVDDAAFGEPLQFKTCLPAGCIVPVAFEADAVAALREGGNLNVQGAAADGGEVAFAISLKGFAAALDRTVALAN